MLVVFLMVTTCQYVLANSLDDGKDGVYDSPMATDELAMEFGFLFGGGRSGVKGMEALQDHNDPMPHGPHPDPIIAHQDMSHKLGKKVVELSPLIVENIKTRKPSSFSRFLAVP
eukprot:TRINITY_DN29474_c0_g1_i1.p2 TRINITY_DN29474_c0_g1~~TRINITY_DN29474_c0_g1_i1.p2  ORF type:complete len:114 (-),score=33.75 TRINITY_DN29474_c0_g1_i1:88-429(-)